MTTMGSLFTGMGGLDSAVHALTGADLRWTSDINDGANKVIAHHWPALPNLGDITTVDWSTVPPVDIITGGFPCQDVSAAGRRGGLVRYGNESNRSGLWAHMAQAIDNLRPSLVVAENVRGLTSAKADTNPDLLHCDQCVADAEGQSMRALGAVLGDLAAIGYDAAWHGVRASDAGAPHQRFRVFIIAWPADTDCTRLALRGVIGGDEGEERQAAERDREAPDGIVSLPTPDVGMGKRSARIPEHAEAGRLAATRDNRTDRTVTLNDAVSLLPTPEAKLAGSGPDYARMAREGSGGHDLTTALYLLNKANEDAVLPTPSVSDGLGGHINRSGDRQGELLLGGIVRTFLPTPRATEGVNGGPNQRGSSGDLTMSSAVHRDWGIYQAAIRRWEALVGPAPAPTETGPRGGNRLSPKFVEWMMGLPAGHVTNPAIGLTRTQQLTVLGNGVVPQQAELALRHLFGAIEMARQVTPT